MEDECTNLEGVPPDFLTTFPVREDGNLFLLSDTVGVATLVDFGVVGG